MDSDYDDDLLYDDDSDSGNESPVEEDSDGDADCYDDMDPGFADEPSGSSSQKIEDDYHYEVMSKIFVVIKRHNLTFDNVH